MDNLKFSAFLVKYNPAVSNRWLITFAGTTWAAVGVLLCHYSYGWLSPLAVGRAFIFAGVGLTVALVVYQYGMSKIANRNLSRLSAMTGKKCVFGFLTWKSYANIAVMVTMGVTLRHSALPKDYLSLIYTSMGGSLLLGSLQYFRGLWHTMV